jgi:hypothetical protein
MTACLIPTQAILAFFDPVLNVAPTIVHLYHLISGRPGIGHYEIASWKELSKMPSIFATTLRLLLQL